MARQNDGDFNKFILDEIYPDPLQILGNHAPRLSELFSDCVFALDASVLLAPFELGEKVAENVATIYDRLAAKRRLYAPKRAIREFANRRTALLAEVHDELFKANSKVPGSTPLGFPFLESVEEYAALSKSTEQLTLAKKNYLKSLEALRLRLTDWAWDDHISQLYARLFTADTIIDHSVTPQLIEEDLARRQRHKIPPGFEDAGKPDGGIGDLLIWHSLVEFAKTKKRHVVFVSNDGKIDWVVKTKQGVVINCRPELSQEFTTKTGQFFGIVGFSRFLELNGATEDTVRKAGALEHRETLSAQMLSAIIGIRSQIQKDRPTIDPLGFGEKLEQFSEEFETAWRKSPQKSEPTFTAGATRELWTCLCKLVQINRDVNHCLNQVSQTREPVLLQQRKLCDAFIQLSADWIDWYRTTNGAM